MREMEYGRCEICGEEAPIFRKYYFYNIKCACHAPKHFQIVRHCKNCTPKPPMEIKVVLKGKDYFAGEEL